LTGHRGEPVLAAEETLPSFQAAIDGGARTIEMDVQFTSDDVPVLMHDPIVDRTTNGTGPVSAYTFARLETLDAGDDAVVPSFASVLDLAQQHGVDVVAELKLDHATPDNTAAYLAAVQASGMAGSLTVESFYADNLAALHAADPALPLAFITTTSTAPAAILAMHAGTVLIALSADTPRRTADYHEAGLKVWVWTVDSAAELAAADRDGADAVLTDDFTELTTGRICTAR
jgi:glycerophosphoryl diester phosphodiesterase